MIYFRCGDCAGVIRGRDEDAGTNVTCPHCGKPAACPPRPAITVTRPRRGFIGAAAGLVAMGAIGSTVWNVATTPRKEPSNIASSNVSAIEARQRDILRQAIDRPGDPALRQLFIDINTRHFNGRLPAIPVVWEPALADVGALVKQAFTLEGMFGIHAGKAMILLHPRLAPDREALTRALAHEMVHAYLHTIGESTTSHGPRFQAELKRLANEGAFVGIVADEAERASLRAWIDAESSRLATDSEMARREAEAIELERADLERAVADLQSQHATAVMERTARPDQSAVDALNERREAYNRRVAAAMAHAERGRADLVTLNREIERYNLMLAYPDGLGGERSAQRATP